MKETEGFQNVAVYHDMGLGKTFTGSEIMFRYGCKPNLVVCQKSKVNDWVDHFTKFYNCKVYDLTKAKQLEEYMGVAVGMKYTCVGIINYELAWRRAYLNSLEGFCLMLDESSLIQNRTAKQTKFIMKLRPDHVVLLSGTPVGGKYENLWTQIRLLGWKISHDLYEKQYVNWKKIQVGEMVYKVVDKEDPYKDVDRLKTKMRLHGAIFKKTEEVIDLPEQTFTKILVPSTKEYRKFKRNKVIAIDTLNLREFRDDSDFQGRDVAPRVELVGDTSLTDRLYSRQLASQYNPHKLQAVKDLIQSTNDRLIIFYSFNDELDKLKAICESLERPVSEVNGHCKDLTAYEQESNSVTLCQYQSASKGLNLQKCNKIIYFSLTQSSEDFEQSKKRIHRIGQEQPCFYYILIAEGTVDGSILKTLEQMKDFTDELFRETEGVK